MQYSESTDQLLVSLIKFFQNKLLHLFQIFLDKRLLSFNHLTLIISKHVFRDSKDIKAISRYEGKIIFYY